MVGVSECQQVGAIHDDLLLSAMLLLSTLVLSLLRPFWLPALLGVPPSVRLHAHASQACVCKRGARLRPGRAPLPSESSSHPIDKITSRQGHQQSHTFVLRPQPCLMHVPSRPSRSYTLSCTSLFTTLSKLVHENTMEISHLFLRARSRHCACCMQLEAGAKERDVRCWWTVDLSRPARAARTDTAAHDLNGHARLHMSV
jgi:hypothetical protein